MPGPDRWSHPGKCPGLREPIHRRREFAVGLRLLVIGPWRRHGSGLNQRGPALARLRGASTPTKYRVPGDSTISSFLGSRTEQFLEDHGFQFVPKLETPKEVWRVRIGS